jgi:hypothetical protein
MYGQMRFLILLFSFIILSRVQTAFKSHIKLLPQKVGALKTAGHLCLQLVALILRTFCARKEISTNWFLVSDFLSIHFYLQQNVFIKRM